MSQDQAQYGLGRVDEYVNATNERGGSPSMSALLSMALCPGRYMASKGIASTDTSDSIEGTKRHELMDRNADTFEDAAQEQAVITARELESEAAHACGIAFCDVATYREIRLAWWRPDTAWECVTGRFDRLDVCEMQGSRVGLLYDYKMLWGDHGAASDNLQLMGYAYLCARYYGLDRVYVALIQPCLSKDKQLSLSCYLRQSLAVAERKIETILNAAFAPNAPRIAGVEQCRYCRAFQTCTQAQSDVIVKLANAVNSELMLTPTSEGLEQIEYVSKLWAQFADGYKAKAKEMLAENPDAIEGWRLSTTKRKSIVNTAEAVRLMQEQLADNVLADTLTMSLAKVADAYADATKMSKKAAREVVEAILAECIEVKESEPSLKRG
jgi:hypothetical protein